MSDRKLEGNHGEKLSEQESQSGSDERVWTGAGAVGFGVEDARALMTEAWLGTFGRSTVEVGLNRRRSEEIMLAGERRAVAGERGEQ